jgi:hypothetical protein
MKSLTKVLPALFFIITSCGYTSINQDKKPIGEPYEITVICDPGIWNSKIGETFRQILENPGLPDQKKFRLRSVNPLTLDFKEFNNYNLVYLTNLQDNSAGSRFINGYFNQQQRESINQNPDYFLINLGEHYISEQSLLIVFGINEAELIRNLKTKREKIYHLLNEAEQKRVYSRIYKNGRQPELETRIQKTCGFTFQIPISYRLVKLDTNFIWLQSKEENVVRNLFAFKTPYLSEFQFEKKALLELQDSIFGKINETGTSAMSEIKMLSGKMQYNKVVFKKDFAAELTGNWSFTHQSKSISVVSISTTDELIKNFYLLEGINITPYSINEFPQEQRIIISTVKFGKFKEDFWSYFEDL